MSSLGIASGDSRSSQDTAMPLQASGTPRRPSPSALNGVTRTYVRRLKSSASSLILIPQRRMYLAQSRPSSGLGRTLSAAGTAAKAAAKTTIRLSQDFLLGRKSIGMEPDDGRQPDAQTTHRWAAELQAAGSRVEGDLSCGGAGIPSPSASAEVGQKRKHSGDCADPVTQEAPKPKSRITSAPDDSSSKRSSEEKDDYILHWMSDQRDVADPGLRRTWSPDGLSSMEPPSKTIYHQAKGGSEGHLPFSRHSSPPLHSQRQNQRGSVPMGQTALDPRMIRVIQDSRQDRLSYPHQQDRLEAQPALDHRTSVPSRSDSFPPTAPPSDVSGHMRRGSGATLTTNSGTVSDSTSITRWSVCTSATTATNATSADILLAQTKRSRPESRASSLLGRPTISPRPSIPNISRARTWLSQEADDCDQKSLPPVPALPPNINHIPINILLDSAMNPSPIVSHVIKAGNHAQQRREVISGNPSIKNPPVESQIPAAAGLLVSLAPDGCHDGLSIIDEHLSDAGSSKTGHLAQPDDEEMADRVSSLRRRRDGRSRDRSEGQASETATLTSHQADSPSSDTSATSLDDSPEPEGSSPDGSDSDSASVCSDHTDVSLLNAFYSHPAPFGPDLLSILFSVKEALVACIRQQVESAAQREDDTRHHNGDPTSSTSTSSPQDSSGRSSSFRKDAGKVKRPFREDEQDDGPGRGDGDGDKRRKPNSPPQATLLLSTRKFACPFQKRYGNRDWFTKACYGPGFPSVHRVKEHIYRRHGIPFKCDRCHSVFKNDEERLAHVRNPDQCVLQDPPAEQEITCLDQGKYKKLRKREQNGLAEEERWKRVYSIVFPDQVVPSPYQDDCLEFERSDAIRIARFRQVMPGPLAQSIASALANHPQAIQVNDAFLQVIRVAIESFFDNLLSRSSDQSPEASSRGSSPAADVSGPGSDPNGEDQSLVVNNSWAIGQRDILQLPENGFIDLIFDQISGPSIGFPVQNSTDRQLFSPYVPSEHMGNADWEADIPASNLVRSQHLGSIHPSRPRSMGVYDLPSDVRGDNGVDPSSLTISNMSTEAMLSHNYEGIRTGATTSLFYSGIQNQMANLRAMEEGLVVTHQPSGYLPPISGVGGDVGFDASAFTLRHSISSPQDTGAPDANIEDGNPP